MNLTSTPMNPCSASTRSCSPNVNIRGGGSGCENLGNVEYFLEKQHSGSIFDGCSTMISPCSGTGRGGAIFPSSGIGGGDMSMISTLSGPSSR